MSEPWNAISTTIKRATAAGTLFPFETNATTVRDRDLPFVVRTISDGAVQRKVPKTHGDPFEPPWEPSMLITEIGDSHAALLNKFPVIDQHALLVTRQFEEQQNSLTASDFAAIDAFVGTAEAAVFYNGGPVAGASQPHKHIQIAPIDALPVCREMRPSMPFEFIHAIGPRGNNSFQTYNFLWYKLGRSVEKRQPMPYNLLMTPRLMLLVPRRRAAWKKISVNAMGFGGSLKARDADQLMLIRDTGPLKLLRKLSFTADQWEAL